MNVLIVDDSTVSRMLIKEKVEALNYNVVGEAKNGSEGLSLFKSLMPDIVITDIEMPEMNGIEMTKRIYETHKNIKIIVISSVVSKKITQRAILSGAFVVLKKPLDDEKLSKVLRVHQESAYLVSCNAFTFSLKNSISRYPYALFWSVLILLLVPSIGPDDILLKS